MRRSNVGRKRIVCLIYRPRVTCVLGPLYESGGNHSAAGLGQTDVRLVLPHCPTDVRAVLLSVRVSGTRGKGILLRYRSARISAHPLRALGCSAR